MPAEFAPSDNAKSPCRDICVAKTTIYGRMCIGCGRTVTEIHRWYDLSEDERAAANIFAAWRLDSYDD